MKTTFKRVVSFMLSMMMVFGVCSTALVAYATAPVGNAAEPLVYVSIGDSMTNGYGMEGYDGNSGIVNYANNTYANKFAAYLAGYNGPIVNDQVIFTGTNGIVDHRQLAMSGYRAEDLHWTLELDYKDSSLIQKLWDNQHDGNNWSDVRVKWFGDMGFVSGDYRTWTDLVDSDYRYADGAARILNSYHNNPVNSQYYQSEYAGSVDLTAVSNGIAQNPYFPQGNEDSAVMGSAYLQISTEFFQRSVKDADVVSLALGNTNFGTYMLGHLIDAMNGDTSKFSSRYDIEAVYTLAALDPDLETKVRSFVANIGTMIDGMIGGLAGDNLLVKEEMNYIISYCIVSYLVNYIGSIDAILTLNEKESVDIIQIALINAYAREGAEGGSEDVTLGDVVDKLYTPINAFVAAIPTYRQATGNELYKKAEFYYAEAETVESMVDVYGDDFYKDKTTGQYVAYPDWNFDIATMIANPNSIVRERFIEEGDGIVKGTTFGSLAGVVKSKYGIDLRRDLTVEEVIAYEAMTDAEKAAKAVSDPATAMSIAFYLAFEHSTIKAGTGTVTLTSLGASGDIVGAFSEVMTVFGNTIGSAAASYASVAASALANAFNAGMAANGLSFSVAPEQILAIYAGATTAEDVAAALPDPYKAVVVDNLKTAVGNVSNICMMLAMPRVLSDAMTGNEEKGIAPNDTVCGLLCLNARLLIGTGIGGHPSPNGHHAVYEAMKTAYEEGYTSKNKTFENLLYIATEYYDEIFALVDSMSVKHADYNLKKNSSYIAFGDNAKISADFATYLTGEAQSKAGLAYKTNATYAIDDSRIATLATLLTVDPSLVANADIISIGYSLNKTTEDTLNILFDLLATGNSTLLAAPLDWDSLLGAEAAVEVKNYIGGMKQTLDDQGMNIKPGELNPMLSSLCKGDLTISEAAEKAIEYFAYYAIEYVVLLPKVVSAIKQINPNALIMVNAVSNPAEGAGVAMGETQLMFGGYFDIIVDLVYMSTAALSITNENVVLVPTTEATTTFTGKILGEGTSGLSEILQLMLDKKQVEINPTDEGNAYTLAAMKAALNVTVKRADFNFDGKVTVADTVYLLQHLSNPAKKPLPQSGDVNGDGLVNKADVTYLLRNILSPAKYPLK